MHYAASLVVDMVGDNKVAVAILVAAASVVAIGMGTEVVAGLVAHTMAVKGAIGVAVLVDYS